MIDGRPIGALYTVDLSTGAANLIGPHDGNDLFGLEIHPNGTLYSSGYSPTGFWSIDQASGQSTFIADHGIAGDGLAYDTLRDQLVAIEGGGGRLYTIDPVDASTVVLSQAGFINNCGLAYEPIGDLYWAIDWSGNLFTYDPNDGYSRTDQLNGLGAHDGMTFVPGFFPE